MTNALPEGLGKISTQKPSTLPVGLCRDALWSVTSFRMSLFFKRAWLQSRVRHTKKQPMRPKFLQTWHSSHFFCYASMTKIAHMATSIYLGFCVAKPRNLLKSLRLKI